MSDKDIPQGAIVFESPAQLAEFAHELVSQTLATVGLGRVPKPTDKISRRQMVSIVGRTRFEAAVNSGMLKVHKNNPEAVNSTMFAYVADWQRFLKQKVF